MGGIVKGQEKLEILTIGGSIGIVQLRVGIAGLCPNVEGESIDACNLCLTYVVRPVAGCIRVSVANLGRNQLESLARIYLQ